MTARTYKCFRPTLLQQRALIAAAHQPHRPFGEEYGWGHGRRTVMSLVRWGLVEIQLGGRTWTLSERGKVIAESLWQEAYGEAPA